MVLSLIYQARFYFIKAFSVLWKVRFYCFHPWNNYFKNYYITTLTKNMHLPFWTNVVWHAFQIYACFTYMCRNMHRRYSNIKIKKMMNYYVFYSCFSRTRLFKMNLVFYIWFSEHVYILFLIHTLLKLTLNQKCVTFNDLWNL